MGRVAEAVTMRRMELSGLGLDIRSRCRGCSGAPLVLLLHGFPQTSHSWRHQLPALARNGYFAAAPNQRGYSPHARPSSIADYSTDKLVTMPAPWPGRSAMSRYHLVGHDWGGQFSWLFAARFPEELDSLTVLSRPHPAAFARAMKGDAAQPDRSRHHRTFLDANAAHELLADDAHRLRSDASNQGVADADVDAYLSRLGNFEALDAAINWYRSTAVAVERRGERAAGQFTNDVSMGRSGRNGRPFRRGGDGEIRDGSLSIRSVVGRRSFHDRPGAGPGDRIAAAMGAGTSVMPCGSVPERWSWRFDRVRGDRPTGCHSHIADYATLTGGWFWLFGQHDFVGGLIIARIVAAGSIVRHVRTGCVDTGLFDSCRAGLCSAADFL